MGRPRRARPRRRTATNGLAGTVAATTLHDGRSRVRVGQLLAELPVGETATLERGTTAYAIFAPEAVRLIPTDPIDQEATQ